MKTDPAPDPHAPPAAHSHTASHPSPPSLHALCRAAAAGDADAAGHLLLIHHARFLGFARRKVGPDWHARIDPEDLLQEAYADAFATIATFEDRGEESFYRWVTRIIEHRFIDHARALRRKKRDAAREVRGGGGGAGAAGASRYDTLLARLAAAGPTVTHNARRDDALAAMMACIARLPDDYRAVVERLHLNEEPIAAVAADMGRTPDALRRLSGRAIDKLHECMGRASKYLSITDGTAPPEPQP